MLAVTTETAKTNHTREAFQAVEKVKRKTGAGHQARGKRKTKSEQQEEFKRAAAAIEPMKNYTRPEAASVVPCSVITLIRAYESRHLLAYRVGRNVVHSGQHLIDWLEAGGKTGRVGNQTLNKGGEGE